ncbi:hypothetical protein CTI12_AA520610 [Artemisia annua]|uniref:Root meristem growth factor 8 n=1 Tax=Artemisia annua TaxID=35608 RepID=A0A2U1L7V3_ARTAN|nr:hypothetical protein CTI12_AA520610 [Artemisia annua]
MMIIVTMLCIALSLLLAVNAASIHANQLQASHELANDHYHHDHQALPRKLMVNYKVEGYEDKDLEPLDEKNTASSGESHKGGKKEVRLMVHAAKGTRQEWLEGSDPTHEFFTMDYGRVKRRRPIHNKSFPKAVTSSP